MSTGRYPGCPGSSSADCEGKRFISPTIVGILHLTLVPTPVAYRERGMLAIAAKVSNGAQASIEFTASTIAQLLRPGLAGHHTGPVMVSSNGHYENP